MLIELMRTSDDMRVLNKETETIATEQCKLKENVSIENPRVILKRNFSSIPNYARIGDFNRFYFVQEMITLNSDLVELILEVDPLTSFADEIRAIQTVIVRSEQNLNPRLVDNNVPIKSDNIVRKSIVGNLSGESLILVCNG